MINPGMSLRVMWESYWERERERLGMSDLEASQVMLAVKTNFFAGVASVIFTVDVRGGKFDCDALQKECDECGFPFQIMTTANIASIPDDDSFPA